MKLTVKILCVLCVLAMLGTFLVSCGKETEQPDPQPKDDPQTEPKEEDKEPVFDYSKGDRLDSTLDYEGKTFEILTWNTQLCNDWVDTVSEETSAVDRELYNHMKRVEERLHLAFHVETKPGRYDQRNDFIGTIESYASVNMAPDLVSQYSLAASIGMVHGVYEDISDADYIDFDAPWWNETLVEGNKVNGGLYYLTGDITPTVFYNMNGVMFNKPLLADNNIDLPYDLVRDGNWTIETLLQMIRNTSVNPRTDNTYDTNENVLYGLLIEKLAVDAFQTGFGVVAITKAQNGAWQFSNDFTGDRATDIVDKLRDIAYKNTDVFYDKTTSYSDHRIFNQQKALFSVYTMYYTQIAIRDYGLTVGVVPTPKYDAAQENYATRLSVTTTLFSVPKGAEDVDRSCAVMEALASDGYHKVTPVVFESTFCSKLSDAPDDAEMFNKIRDSIVYDPGDFIDSTSTYSAFRNAVNNDQSWATFMDTRKDRFASGLAALNKVGLPEA